VEIDPARLRLLADLETSAGRAAIGELLQAYANDTRHGLLDLRETAQAGDRTAMRRLAHKMKGSSAMIGASHLAGLLAQVEAAAADPAADVRGPIATAERAFEAALVELGAWFGEGV